MQVYKLSKDILEFPNTEEAIDEGLLAIGGNISQETSVSLFQRHISLVFRKMNLYYGGRLTRDLYCFLMNLNLLKV